MSTATEAGEIKEERMPSEDGECDDMDTSAGADLLNNSVKKPTIEFKTVGSTTITYKLYKAIWSLQKYFNNPKLLFTDGGNDFKEFERYAAQVIGLFQDYQSDSEKSLKNGKSSEKPA